MSPFAARNPKCSNKRRLLVRLQVVGCFRRTFLEGSSIWARSDGSPDRALFAACSRSPSRRSRLVLAVTIPRAKGLRRGVADPPPLQATVRPQRNHEAAVGVSRRFLGLRIWADYVSGEASSRHPSARERPSANARSSVASAKCDGRTNGLGDCRVSSGTRPCRSWRRLYEASQTVVLCCPGPIGRRYRLSVRNMTLISDGHCVVRKM